MLRLYPRKPTVLKEKPQLLRKNPVAMVITEKPTVAKEKARLLGKKNVAKVIPKKTNGSQGKTSVAKEKPPLLR